MVDRLCPVCGDSYQADPARLLHGRQTTCSRQCSYSLRGQKRSVSTTESCGVCGTPATRAPSKKARSKTSVFLCSRKCAYQARSMGLVGREVVTPYAIPETTRQMQAERLRAANAQRKATGNYRHTEETKAKLSQTTALAIAEGRIPRVSGLELRVGEVLHHMGVSAIHQYHLRGVHGRYEAVLDYFLPELGVALEFNGTFWHADPRVYPNGPVKPCQIRVAEKYQRKRALLAELHIPLIEVWELDFKADPESSVRRALGSLTTEPTEPVSMVFKTSTQSPR